MEPLFGLSRVHPRGLQEDTFATVTFHFSGGLESRANFYLLGFLFNFGPLEQPGKFGSAASTEYPKSARDRRIGDSWSAMREAREVSVPGM